jgi:uncharacterized membrane protein YoaK (UPF0700 family)
VSHRSRRRGSRVLLLLGLTVVSAATDAISYLGLGHVFPANMTGNTVLLGIGLATGDLGGATRSATALGAFLLGAAATGAAVPDRVSRQAFLVVVAVETAMLGGLCGWWTGIGAAAPAGAARYGLVALAGVAMGTQSGMVRAMGVPVSTTYITGTWTALSVGVAARLRRSSRTEPADPAPSHALQALVVGAYLATAAGAGLAHATSGAFASAVPVAVLLLLLAVAARQAGWTEDRSKAPQH